MGLEYIQIHRHNRIDQKQLNHHYRNVYYNLPNSYTHIIVVFCELLSLQPPSKAQVRSKYIRKGNKNSIF